MMILQTTPVPRYLAVKCLRAMYLIVFTYFTLPITAIAQTHHSPNQAEQDPLVEVTTIRGEQRPADALRFLQTSFPISSPQYLAQRAEVDRERSTLERMIAKLTITAPANNGDSYLVRLVSIRISNGVSMRANDVVAIPSTDFGMTRVLNPGSYEIETSFQGRTVSTIICLGPGDEKTLDISQTGDVLCNPPSECRGRPLKSVLTQLIGWGLIGAGAGATLLGGGFAWAAHSKQDSAELKCGLGAKSSDSNACTPEGLALHRSALSYKTAAYWSLGLGAASVVAGVSMLIIQRITTRDANHAQHQVVSDLSHGITLMPVLGPTVTGLSLQADW